MTDEHQASTVSGPKAASGPACPICGKPRDAAFRPFCSKRCADIDLGRWLNERYTIPVTAEEDEDGEGALPGGNPASPERDEI